MQLDPGIELVRHQRILRFCSAAAKFASVGGVMHDMNGAVEVSLEGMEQSDGVRYALRQSRSGRPQQ